jgi:hypothetical protein
VRVCVRVCACVCVCVCFHHESMDQCFDLHLPQVQDSTSKKAWPMFQQLNTLQTLAWVRAIQGPGYGSGLLPGNITFEIKYYQFNTTTKKLLRASFTMNDWYKHDSDTDGYSYATATSFRGGQYRFYFRMVALSWLDVSSPTTNQTYQKKICVLKRLFIYI